jgi:hypothetical protein
MGSKPDILRVQMLIGSINFWSWDRWLAPLTLRWSLRGGRSQGIGNGTIATSRR